MKEIIEMLKMKEVWDLVGTYIERNRFLAIDKKRILQRIKK